MNEEISINLKTTFCFFFIFCCLLHFEDRSKVMANEIHVAVASNFYNPFKEIVNTFQQKTKHSVQIIPGSTGKLYAQIVNGAPFALFLSADTRRPILLESEGRAVSGSRFTYALGKIILWSPNPKKILDNGLSTLLKKNLNVNCYIWRRYKYQHLVGLVNNHRTMN